MAENKTPARHPWAELYDIESGVKGIHIERRRAGPGRPTKPFKRLKTSITLTDEEKRIYEKLAYELGSKLHPNKVTKGQVIGLALRLLHARLEGLPASLDSWGVLAGMLFGGAEEE